MCSDLGHHCHFPLLRHMYPQQTIYFIMCCLGRGGCPAFLCNYTWRFEHVPQSIMLSIHGGTTHINNGRLYACYKEVCIVNSIPWYQLAQLLVLIYETQHCQARLPFLVQVVELLKKLRKYPVLKEPFSEPPSIKSMCKY
jgi:hypothetical protein